MNIKKNKLKELNVYNHSVICSLYGHFIYPEKSDTMEGCFCLCLSIQVFVLVIDLVLVSHVTC